MLKFDGNIILVNSKALECVTNIDAYSDTFLFVAQRFILKENFKVKSKMSGPLCIPSC